MSDIIKLISKSLHPFGYQVKPRKGLNLLKVPNLDRDADINSTRDALGNAAPKPPNGNLDNLIIYVRTCMRENRNKDTRPRCTGVDTIEHSLRCIYTLLRSAENAKTIINIQIRVLDDHSDAAPLARLNALIKTTSLPSSIETTAEKGQGASLYEQFSRGRKDDAIVYFCEDDFLHEDNGIEIMVNFYRTLANRTGSHLVIYPMEHSTLYNNHYPAYVVLGEDRHWRTTRHATHTFLTHGKIVEEYWKFFENTKFVGHPKKRQLGSEKQTTNNLFQHIPGFSPMKPCAVHLQFESLLPPFYDWRPLWERSTLPPEALAA